MVDAVGIEQVFFVAGADGEHPLIFGEGFADPVGVGDPVAARDDQHTAVRFGVALMAGELQAGWVQAVGEQQIEDVLVPLLSGCEPADRDLQRNTVSRMVSHRCR